MVPLHRLFSGPIMSLMGDGSDGVSLIVHAMSLFRSGGLPYPTYVIHSESIISCMPFHLISGTLLKKNTWNVIRVTNGLIWQEWKIMVIWAATGIIWKLLQ